MADLATAKGFEGTDRFGVVRQLGAGGMGVVYEVIDQQRDERVALKFLPEMAPASLYAFKHEFRRLADVSHPNLVGLYELFSDHEQCFFTMELVEGVDLKSFICGDAGAIPSPSNPFEETAVVTDFCTDTSSVPEETSRTVENSSLPSLTPNLLERLHSTLKQLVAGVQAVHAQGLVHRDIKPQNILVQKDGRVVILDFGLTATSQTDEVDRQIVGTVNYMSPEQADGQALAPSSDWYSVGAILYEVLTGRCPFEGRVARVLNDKRSIDPVPARKINPAIPDVLSAITMALLSRDPDSRPQAGEVLRWLVEQGTHKVSPAVDRNAAIVVPRFVGRKEPLHRMQQEYESVRMGGTSVVLVRGESGTGKTALVQHFLEQLPLDDHPVILTGRCYEQESVPFKAFDNLIDELTRHLEKLPEQRLATILPRDIASLMRIFPVVQRVPFFADASGRSAPISSANWHSTFATGFI